MPTRYIGAPSIWRGPWKNQPHPSPLSTPCARFFRHIKASPPPDDRPLALSVFEARAEVVGDDSATFPTLFASPSGKLIFAPTRGGYKLTSPYLSAFCPVDSPSDSIKGTHIKLGLAGIAYHGAADDERELLFAGDSTRVKSYSWADGDRSLGSGHLRAVHTLDSKGFSGAMGVLPDGRIARSGTGKIAIWDLNNLPTHEEAENGIIGEPLDLSYSTREDVYDIEESSGSKPGAIITLGTEPKLKIFRWHIHPSQPAIVLAGSDPNVGPRNSHDSEADARCLALDLEHGGKTVIEYFDHRGRINGFSTSKGDPDIFTTAANDGYARMFDVRMEVPPFALRAGPGKECTSAVLCHPDGIPYVFTSEKSAESITLWDVRTRSPVYELATGNNTVEGMIWNETRQELWAATSCQYMDMDGDHRGYRRAILPREERVGEARDDDMDDDDEEGSDEDDYDDDDIEGEDDPAWPKEASHEETYFGHIFDSGDDRVFRYAFKNEPNLKIVPSDGGAMADRCGRGYW